MEEDYNYRWCSCYGIDSDFRFRRSYNIIDYYQEKLEHNLFKELRKEIEKLDNIIFNIISEFSESGIKIICKENYISIKFTILFETTEKKVDLVYDRVLQKLDGLVQLSFKNGGILNITESEVEVINRSLLFWIFENV